MQPIPPGQRCGAYGRPAQEEPLQTGPNDPDVPCQAGLPARPSGAAPIATSGRRLLDHRIWASASCGKPVEWTRRRSRDVLAGRVKSALMTGTQELLLGLPPVNDAAGMGTSGRQYNRFSI